MILLALNTIHILAEFVLFVSLAMILAKAAAFVVKSRIKKDEFDGTYKVPEHGLYKVSSSYTDKSGNIIQHESDKLMKIADDVPPAEVQLTLPILDDKAETLEVFRAKAGHYGSPVSIGKVKRKKKKTVSKRAKKKTIPKKRK